VEPHSAAPGGTDSSPGPRDSAPIIHWVAVAPRAPALAQPPRPTYRLNLLLFVLTVLTSLVSGAYYQISFSRSKPIPIGQGEFLLRLIDQPSYLLYGLPFCFTLLGILFAHEMGHYLACRYHGIVSTLPYFLPAPFGPVGTFGAFIKIKSPITNKKALFDVGIAGPIAGFVLAVPAMVIGLASSRVVDPSQMVPEGWAVEVIGEPLLYKIIALFVAPPGGDIYLHPIAFAAWFGLLATALNLFPIGQLDGGHILYAVLGRWHRYISRGFWAVTLVLAATHWPGWFVWGLLTFLLGLDHPRTWDEHESIGRGRFVLFLVALAIFVLCFVPAPISLQTM